MGLLSTVLRRSHFRFLGLLFVLISCSLLFLSWTSSERPDFDPSFGDLDDLPRHRFAWTKPPSRPWKHNHPGSEKWDVADIPPAELNTTGSVWEDRADKVRQAFLHAYRSYDKCARGADELLPLTCTGTKNFNGWGVTLVEALDTMWVMGLYDEFGDALPDVAQMDFGMAEHERAPFFETVIRYLGGLLSAYALSGEAIFVVRADRLGAALLPAFDTPSGFPTYSVNTETGATGSSWVPGAAFWAEVFSCQLEYKYLAYLTGKKEYYERAENLMQRLYTANTDATGGLYPTKWKTSSGEPMNDQVSVGALADSGYEYLLKQYLLSGRTDIQARDTYIRSANLIISNLLFVTPDRGLLYVTDTSGLKQIPSHTMEHLSCFLPGLFALGVHTLGDLLTPAERELHMWAARGLGQTCYIMYADQPSGLAPEEITMMSWMGPYNAHRTAEDVKIEGLWMTHLKKWQAEGEGDDRENVGQGGDPPGVREVNPIKEAVGNINIMKSREYRIKRTPYLLRPETVESFHLLWTVTGDSVWRERGWEVFEAIERNTKVEKGYASVDDVTRLPTKKMNMMPSFFLAETLKYLYLLFTDEEIIPLDQWVFNTEAHPLPVFEWSNWEKKHYGIP